ncbi:hypothetical protein [Saccharothrix longispora]|uniref:hypothetical protein n=1 Tax=Saccharothrix longispora TaxID=33920 RepID=UPI00398CCA03
MAIANGKVVAWGENDRGQVGDGTQTDRETPVRVCAPGATDCNGRPLTRVASVYAGLQHSFAVRSSG